MTGIFRPSAFVDLLADLPEPEPRPKPWPKDPAAPRVMHHNTIAFAVSREMALDFGLVEPTPDEKAEQDRRAAEYRVRKIAAWETYDSALEVLARVTEPLALKVLDLHKPVQRDYATKCQGCDAEGSDREDPDWPCRTAQLVAEAHGVTLPNAWDLSLDYDHETREWVRPS